MNSNSKFSDHSRILSFRINSYYQRYLFCPSSIDCVFLWYLSYLCQLFIRREARGFRKWGRMIYVSWFVDLWTWFSHGFLTCDTVVASSFASSCYVCSRRGSALWAKKVTDGNGYESHEGRTRAARNEIHTLLLRTSPVYVLKKQYLLS
jgi:hypothetical protein